MRIVVRGLLAAVWFYFGTYCKVLDGMPSHERIVGRILGEAWAGEITVAIGLGETLLALWILSGRMPRASASLQVGLVLAMNVLEFLLAAPMLMFGRLNLPIAVAFCGLVIWWGFVLERSGPRSQGAT